MKKSLFFMLFLLLFLFAALVFEIKILATNTNEDINMGDKNLIYQNNFEDDNAGIYAKEDLKQDWNNPPWETGISEGRVKIVYDSQNGKSLEVFYPGGNYSPSETGAQWKLNFDKPYEELVVSYKVKFKEGFDFVKGGKLPGLAGGNATSGGNFPNGTDGWSARIMWRADGKVVQYVYHMGQPSNYGEDFPWAFNGTDIKFTPGKWHEVKTRIVLNMPNQKDGVIQSWFDGNLVLSLDNIRFRTTRDLGIDLLYFSTFFGGADLEWATSKDEYVYFDDFIISKK